MRLPVEPLLRVSGCLEAAETEHGDGHNLRWGSSPDTVLARRLGYRNVKEMARTLDWYRIRREGMSWARADQLACALGHHPLEVWGDDWLEAQRVSPRQVGQQKLKPIRREPRWALIGAEMKSAGDEKREQIMAFIVKSVAEIGYPPTVREIGAAVGLRSPATVHAHLAQLQDEGRLTMVPGSPRAMRVVEAA